MLEITNELKDKVVAELLRQRDNYSGGDGAFAKTYDLKSTEFSTLKTGGRKLLSSARWIRLARELEIPVSGRKWNIARTEVFNRIEEEVLFCKEHSKSMIFADDCGIGKTFTAKYLKMKLANCFYIDGSQCKTALLFVRTLARTIGVDSSGTYSEMKADIKYCLGYLPQPVVIIDEAGDFGHEAWLVIKELWNATEGVCGWYMMGADGLRAKVERGKRNKTVGFAEMFSRMAERYSSVVPFERHAKLEFYRKLITDVLSVNMDDKKGLGVIVKRCLTADETGHIGGLRRAESLLILNS